MTDPNERSDPVESYLDVTPEQLDQLHRNCGNHICDGYRAAQVRRSTEQWRQSLLGVRTALAEIDEVTRAVSARVQENARAIRLDRRPHVLVVDEPLAEWERELIAGVAAETERAAHIENLRAGLQHQRVGNGIHF